MSAATAPSLGQLVRGVSGVATLPAVYFRITAVIHRPDASLGEVGTVVKEDTALTGRLLRLVNSSLFRVAKRIDTVSEAIQVVGLSQLEDLALGTTVIQVFKDVPSDLVNMDSFWRHSLATAIGARLIAQQRREANVERFFVAGLLHDIGRPVLYLREPDLSRQALEQARRQSRFLHEVEKEVFGYDHSAVGAELLRSWNIPPRVAEAVDWHHVPAGASRAGVEAAAVHVADLFANALAVGTSGEHLVPQLAPRAWEALGLHVDTVPVLLRTLEGQLEEVAGALL
ncbi:MAG: HDOD domain-containing protein [Gemmatimonadales bacterium]|nr:HDOD domain-containing protein [Gemmatimonadales bacterium]